MITFKKFLVENIVGNTGWVYHRTITNPEDSEILTHGIKPSSNQSAMYGKGLYCCYDINQQLKPDMERYGAYILKGKIDLNGFAILDSVIYGLANPRGNFQEHLRQIGTNMESVQDTIPYTSRIAQDIWEKCKANGYNGIIFTGESDGKVAVIWNRRNFIPYQYSEDNAATWKTLTPDIKSIKRPHDPEYDKDDQAIRFSKILRELSNKQEIGDLTFPFNYKNKIFLKNVKKSGNITANNATEINLPQLQKSGSILARNATEINLPQLQTSGDIIARNLKKIIIQKHLEDKLNVPYDCEIIHPEDNPEETPEIKVNENVTFKKYLMLKESLVNIPLDTAYEIFKNEYDKSTGTSWSYDKFMGRARGWEFYGDEKGYVAVRRQRSGFVKLVGMAGDNRSKLKGIQDLVSQNLPLWGMVSKEIKDIGIRKGMREPNFLERQVLKRSIPPEVLGGAEILEYQKDGGIKLQYPDVGVVVKYLVGTPQYYAKLRTMFGDKIKEKILG